MKLNRLLTNVAARVDAGITAIRTAAVAARSAVERLPRSVVRIYLVGLYIATTPLYANAGIWNGGLCRAYSNILDDELKTAVSLVFFVAGIVAWLLDDGKSNVKTMALKGIGGTLVIANLPVIWQLIFGRAASCV
jgi:hypothetical protein